MGFGYTLAQHRVAVRAIALGQLNNVIKFILKQHLLAEGRHTPLKTQQCHGNLPALTGFTDNIVSAADCTIKKHFIKFRGTRELFDGPNSDAGLVHIEHKKAQTFMALGLRVSARDHKTILRFVGQ